MVGIHELSQIRLFAKFFGQSPNTYLNRYRLGRSLDLLHAGEKYVTEIALSAGFGSSSYFAEIFHKYFGMTPTEYRKRMDIQISSVRKIITTAAGDL